jgi:hypothetical protein
MFDNIAYVPLDLPKVEFPYEELNDFFQKHKLDSYPFTNVWDTFCVKGNVEDWYSPQSTRRGFEKKYDPIDTPYHPALPDWLKQKFKQALDALPYKYCTYAHLLSNKVYVTPHRDNDDNPFGYGSEPEPSGIKIFCSHTNVRTLFMMQSSDSARDFVKIPPDSNSAAINDKKFLHGAKYIGEPKFILSVFGIVDPVKHKELVSRSIQKYKDYVISYDNN